MDIISIVYSYKNDLNNMKLESRNINRLNDLKNIINILGNALSYAENYAMINGWISIKKKKNFPTMIISMQVKKLNNNYIKKSL